MARVLDRLDVVPREDYERLARRVSELERRLAAVTATQRRRVAARNRSLLSKLRRLPWRQTRPRPPLKRGARKPPALRLLA